MTSITLWIGGAVLVVVIVAVLIWVYMSSSKR
jgi:hypothetical protein